MATSASKASLTKKRTLMPVAETQVTVLRHCRRVTDKKNKTSILVADDDLAAAYVDHIKNIALMSGFTPEFDITEDKAIAEDIARSVAECLERVTTARKASESDTPPTPKPA